MPKMATGSAPSTAASSYAKRVEIEFPGPKYNRFLDMLQGNCPDSPMPHRVPISTVRIVDEVNPAPKSHFFKAPKDTSVCRKFVGVLSKPSPDTKTRQVIVHFSQPRDLNFSYIEAIGSILNIDPSFFIIHFERSRINFASKYSFQVPSLLPLESKYLQFKHDSAGHTTLMRLKSGPSLCETSSYHYWLLEHGYFSHSDHL